jgi:hypothetical protein
LIALTWGDESLEIVDIIVTLRQFAKPCDIPGEINAEYIVSSVMELVKVSDPVRSMQIKGPLIDYVGSICLNQLDTVLDHFLNGTEATLGHRVFVYDPASALMEDMRRFSQIMGRINFYSMGMRIPPPATFLAVYRIDTRDPEYLSEVLRGMFASLVNARAIDEINVRMNDINVFLTRLEVSGLSDTEIAAICEPAYSYHTRAVHSLLNKKNFPKPLLYG